MTAEENKRMFTLSCIVADLKAENMELEQRVQQLVNDYNDVVRQLNINEKRKDKDQLKQTIFEMREQCDKLERENRELKFFAKAMHAFVKDKNIYMKKDMECPFRPGCVSVCSTYCLECDSCLGVLEGVGVICEKRLKEANVSFSDNE